MKRNTLNIIFDAFNLVVFTAMITTGLLLKFVLPPGSGRAEMILEHTGRMEKTINLYFGMTRHEWGEIHFYISLAFLCLLIVHLVLHFNWIKAVSFGTKQVPKPLRQKIVVVGIVIFVIFMLSFPWLAQKQTLTRSEFEKVRFKTADGRR